MGRKRSESAELALSYFKIPAGQKFEMFRSKTIALYFCDIQNSFLQSPTKTLRYPEI
jgi:hypothetical protein